MTDLSFSECCLLYVEEAFRYQGNVKCPLVLYEDGPLIQPHILELPQDMDPARVHELVLGTIENAIVRGNPNELFVGYEGFVLQEACSVRVLFGICYSDTAERTWQAQTHGSAVGEWREVFKEDMMGYEGLWQKAKAYQRN